MKRISMLLALSVSALSGIVMAQNARELNVHLDHAVMVHETTLPAGDYSIQIASAGGGDVLIIQSKHSSVMALASRSIVPSKDVAGARLLMQVKDGVYHLDKVVTGDTTFELQ